VSWISLDAGVVASGSDSKLSEPAKLAVPNALDPTPRCSVTDCTEFMRSGTFEK
jgi:hypothetical protein